MNDSKMFASYSFFGQLPSDNIDVCEENKELFFDLMHERMAIWKRRFIDKQDRPWTDNEILRDYKFTNVYRELDRNSQWQIKNILLDDKLSLKNLIWKLMVFRFFNNPETFTFKLAAKWRNGIPDYDEYDEDEFSNFITQVRSAGKNPYTTAYLINSQATPG